MYINGKEIRSIRPMTKDEKTEYFNNNNIPEKNVFCIEFTDNSILYPKFECCKCMQNDKCLFTLATKMP